MIAPIATKLWQHTRMRPLSIGSFLFLMNVGGCVMAPITSSVFTTVTTTTFIETTAVNGASYATTGKGISEHLVSGATDQDCKLYNVIDGKAVCQNYQIDKIPQKDLTTKFRPGIMGSSDLTIEEVIQQSSYEK